MGLCCTGSADISALRPALISAAGDAQVELQQRGEGLLDEQDPEWRHGGCRGELKAHNVRKLGAPQCMASVAACCMMPWLEAPHLGSLTGRSCWKLVR